MLRLYLDSKRASSHGCSSDGRTALIPCDDRKVCVVSTDSGFAGTVEVPDRLPGRPLDGRPILERRGNRLLSPNVPRSSDTDLVAFPCGGSVCIWPEHAPDRVVVIGSDGEQREVRVVIDADKFDKTVADLTSSPP